MVNSIGSYNHMSYMQTRMPRSRPDPAEMFSNVDSDGSGGISQSELETFVQDISDKTGNSIDATDAVSTYDADGDGELSSDELKSFMEANMEPPRAMMRMGGGRGPKGIFNGLDTDSSKGVSQAELNQWAEAMFDETGKSIDTTDAVSTYDADGDGELSSDELKSFMEASVEPLEDMMDSVGSTGRSSSTSAESVVSEYDTDGDGMLSSDELQGYLDNTETTFIKAMMPQVMSAYAMNFENSRFSHPENVPFNFGGFNGYSLVDIST